VLAAEVRGIGHSSTSLWAFDVERAEVRSSMILA